ncbi:MAG: hypothetical protein ACYTGR_13670 [Planctomycetota bacterium]|jgi:hypothetical protein
MNDTPPIPDDMFPRSPMDDLRQELESMRIDTGADVAVFLPLAARLALCRGAESDARHLDRWQAFAERFDVDAALTEHARSTLWDLHHAAGEALGLTLVDAQDLACLDAAANEDASRPLGTETRTWLARVNAEAADTLPDDEAAGFLRAWSSCFRLPINQAINCVANPLGETERMLLASAASEPIILRIKTEELITLDDEPDVEEETDVEEEAVMYFLGAPAPPAQLEDFAAAADDGGPSEHWIESFEERSGDVELPDGTIVECRPRLDATWLVTVEVDPEPKDAYAITDARIGSFRLTQAPDSTRHWSLDISRFSRDVRMRLLDATIGLTLASGPRIHL